MVKVQDGRQAYVDGLRGLADWVEANPSAVINPDALGHRLIEYCLTLGELLDRMDTLSVPPGVVRFEAWEWGVDEKYLRLSLRLPLGRYQLFTDAAKACEPASRVRTVMEFVPPASILGRQDVVPEREIRVVG